MEERGKINKIFWPKFPGYGPIKHNEARHNSNCQPTLSIMEKGNKVKRKLTNSIDNIKWPKFFMGRGLILLDACGWSAQI